MATKKKMLEAAAGGAGGAGLDITEVFSTYLYDGDSTNPSAKVNGIDLAGEGGMVWLKSRTGATNNYIADTEQPLSSGGGATWLYTNTTDAALGSTGTGLLGFNSNGFSTFPTGSGVNSTGNNYASWTFRKSEKFFTCLTYSGTGVARAIAHNLGSVPGMIIVKATSKAANWNVYHRSLTAADHIFLNLTNAKATDTTKWNDTEPTDSVFTVGTHGNVNTLGSTYVAYIFAHNDSGDGEFGPDSDQDIIKCGSYTGNGSSNGPVIDLGFEPQFVLVKSSSGAGTNWVMADTMRGFHNGTTINQIYANTSAAESDVGVSQANPTSTGFKVTATGSNWNTNGGTYIFMAIRRGQLAPPEAGTEVFHALTRSGNNTATEVTGVGFPVDLLIANSRTGGYYPGWTYDRLRGEPYLLTPSTGAEVAGASTSVTLAGYMDGYLLPTSNPNRSASSGYFDYAWKRAPSFCDAVCYLGTGANRTISHNLGVAPEMIFFKKRSGADSWPVYLQSVGNTAVAMYLNETYGAPVNTNIAWFNNTSPTASEITLGWGGAVNEVGQTYIAYLFASLAGVSKVSSYTGNGSSQTINAGFTTGARFILIKRTDSTGDWYIWDTARGVVAGNSPHMSLNTTVDEVTSDDSIDPDSSGFIVNQIAATNINVSSATYIYYAVA